MSFKFNFNIPEQSVEDANIISDVENSHSKIEEQILPITLITINDKHKKTAKLCTPMQIKISDAIKLSTIRPSEAEKNCHNSSSICEAVRSHSDLIAGKYEGGLKIWEGSIDLSQYLIKNDIQFKSKKVLELGCGAALPGLCALQKGASSVHFQDFNTDVLEIMTIPNTLLNTSTDQHSSLSHSCRFYAGDWSSFLHFLKSENEEEANNYDIILTSETIYNPQHHKNLYNIMKSVLTPNGIIFLAAKAYYFGLGGSIQQFLQLVTEDGIFESSVVWSTEEGLSRIIVQLRPKEK